MKIPDFYQWSTFFDVVNGNKYFLAYHDELFWFWIINKDTGQLITTPSHHRADKTVMDVWTGNWTYKNPLPNDDPVQSVPVMMELAIERDKMWRDERVKEGHNATSSYAYGAWDKEMTENIRKAYAKRPAY